MSDRNPFVEKIADAMGCVDWDRCTRYRDGRSKAKHPVCDACVEQARSAIEGMKEAPDHVLSAFSGYAQCEGYVPEGWNAAIDAILAGK